MILYYIRHGQSANNALWDATGSSEGRSDDPPLTSVGEAQAQHVAGWLVSLPEPPADHRHSDLRPSHIYCSLMKRAVQTGSIIASTLGLPLQGWADLHEAGGVYLDGEEDRERYGRPGMSRSQLQRLHSGLQLPLEVSEEGWYNRPFEERPERIVRAQRVLNELLKRHARTDDRVVLVSHGTFYNYLVGALLHLEAEQDWWLLLNNSGVTKIEFHEDECVLAFANRPAHLPPEFIT
jgi:2,3-bisphosphoglycerate-dependent phosphoglycerate mutase